MKGFKDVIILVAISLAAGLCLSGAFIATKGKIEESKQTGIRSSLKEILPFMKEDYEAAEYDFEGVKYSIYCILEKNVPVGGAVKMIAPEGYGGNITLLVGIDRDKKVTGLQLLEHRETPGLGTKAADKKFWSQFIGKSLSAYKFKVKQDKGDVDAITAATITSRAVSHAVEKSLVVFSKYISERGVK